MAGKKGPSPAPRRPRAAHDVFATARTLGLGLPDVEAGTKYDGSPVLKRGGGFMAGLATHVSAEPGTLVVRADIEDRDCLIADAPGTYYLTDYYRRHPIILVRLSAIDREALREVWSRSGRLTAAKARGRSRARRRVTDVLNRF